jgi:thioredoxin reductase (NADPH)
MENEYEVLVIGAGPAGLSAALYLARYDRRVALFDAGQGRSTWHQTAHNYLGFPGGVKTKYLRELGREQLSEYSDQVTCFEHKVEALEDFDGGFKATGQAGEWVGRSVILATGVVDHYPHFENWHEYVGISMFWCITCDGFGCKGKRVIVIGTNDMAAAEALQLKRFSPEIILLTNSHSFEVSQKFRDRLKNADIPIVIDRIDKVIGNNGQMEVVCTEGGLELPANQIFCQHGSTPQTKLAQDLGVDLSNLGYIKVDIEQKTNVPGVYAAGDVTNIHAHQVSTAVHEGGQAASAANYFLYPPEMKDN